MKYVIEDTKTSSGTRIIPMTEEVYECFKRIVEKRKKPKKEPVIDGYKGFLFLDKKDMPEVALHWEKHFEWALASIIESIKSSYQKSRRMFAGIPTAAIWQKAG